MTKRYNIKVLPSQTLLPQLSMFTRIKWPHLLHGCLKLSVRSASVASSQEGQAESEARAEGAERSEA